MVVPTYNERERIAELVQKLFDASKAAAIELEVIVVDDNSPDGTGQVADDLAKSHRMTVVHRPGKLGLGAAVIEGFRVASAPFIGVMDADFSHPPSAVPGLLATIRATGADLVVGSRYVPGGSISNWPWRRRFMSRLACFLARPLSPIRDATSGFFVIRAELARRATIKAGGFKINLELNMRAWPVHLVEVPYRFDDREAGESKMSTKEGLRYLVQLRDLYTFKWTGGPRPPREYRQISPEELAGFMRRK
jgi:dolichol-phosphate mannosyltransferase